MKIAIKLYIILLLITDVNIFAQNYEISTRQRRHRDHIAVEFWAKSLNSPNEPIGDLELRINYNTTNLELSNQQFNNSQTDSITNDFYTDPYVSINSGFANRNGFGNISIIDNGDDISGISLSISNFGSGGIVPSNSERGTFIGRVAFRIIGNVGTGTNSAISWDEPKVLNFLGDDITDEVRFRSPESFRLEGVTFLAPNKNGLVLDRDERYTGFSQIFRGIGYPIFFERSVSSSEYNAPIDEDLAFLIEYNDGSGWKEIGRVVETANRGQILTPRYSSGNLGLPNSSSGNMITAAEGLNINSANYRQPLRVFWEAPNDLRERFEAVEIRVSLLDGDISQNITTRSPLGSSSGSNFDYPTGNYFFLNLDGKDDYLRSRKNFSNPTQITVSAWINPATIGNNDVGLIASSGGPSAPAINGLKEGAWMLYLKDGKYPAFRAREANNSGSEGFFINIVSDQELTEAEYSDESNEHSRNWTHISVSMIDNSAYLYMNGELVAKQIGESGTNERLLSTDHPIWVGVNPNGERTSGFFSGGIKEVQIWRTFLSQERIRFFTNGVDAPNDFTELDLPDDRSGLDIYSKLTGSLKDLATNDPWQNGENSFDFFDGEDLSPNFPFLPDIPHLHITSPLSNAGLNNSPDNIYDVRYVGYQIGDPNDNFTRDLNIEFSIDGGSTWNFIRDPQGVAVGGLNGTSIESGTKEWFPYQNNAASANLRDATPFEKDVQLRITGNNQFNQTTISSKPLQLKVARFFSLEKSFDTKLFLSDHGREAIPTEGLFFSAWIRPYRFPNEDEGLFPLIARIDSSNNIIEYKFSITQKGTLLFEAGNDDNKFMIETDSSYSILEPRKFSSDSVWTHVAFYYNPAEKLFLTFKDGFLLDEEKLNGSVPISFTKPRSDSSITFIGYTPELENGTEIQGFVGQMRELRFWDGIPFSLDTLDENLSALTEFMESRQSIRINDVEGIDSSNLSLSFDFNGSPLNFKGINKAIESENDTTVYITYQNTPPKFIPTLPYLKLVEPLKGTEVRQDEKQLRIRWVGFDYEGTGFRSGSNFQGPPSLEFSVKGGGGDKIAPYQYVGSNYWFGNSQASFEVPDSSAHRFEHNGNDVIFAANLNVSIADPDIDDLNQEPLEQGPIPITLDNARLRITGEYEIEDLTGELKSESGIFSIVPGSNVTIRVLMEGFHRGSAFEMNQIDTTFKAGAPKLHIFEDNDGAPGEKVAELLPTSGYEELNPFNRNSGNNLFANINYRLVDVPEGEYWLVLEQINHLPIMSRFPAPIKYEGDDKSTWRIESGWDFTSWNGVNDNFLPEKDTDPYSNGYYTAFGNADTSKSNPSANSTGLIFNGGLLRNSTNRLPAMVAGDLNRDAKIDSIDLEIAIQNSGTNSSTFDIDQDGNINARDRLIIGSNIGRLSSLEEFNYLIYPNSSSFSSTVNQGSIYSKILNKGQNILQSGFNFQLTAESNIDSDTVSLELFIRSTGNTFTLGESTIAIEFDTTSLSYFQYEKATNILEPYLMDISYPKLDSPNSKQNIRSIELVSPEENEKIVLPNEKISLGKLKFKIDNRMSIYQFQWHNSTIIFDENGSDLTAFAVREPIPPALEFSAGFISPSGGEIYGSGENINIVWENTGGDLWLEFATGDSPSLSAWQKLTSSPLSNTITELEYELPFQISPVNRFRLVDVETDIVLATSRTFSIEIKSGQIVSPSSNSPIFRGGQQMDIWFSTSGYKTVDFEFSSDGINWEPILDNIDAKQQNIKWTIPKITTALGYIRMLAENGNEIDISDRFSVLTGELTFLKPGFNEKVQINDNFSIQWEYSDLEKFTLQLSIDGGANWTDIGENIDAYFRNYEWQVVAPITDQAKLRAVIKSGFETFVLEESETFIIDDFSSVALTKLKPQLITPISSYIELVLDKSGLYDLELIDMNGKISISKTKRLEKGSNRVLSEIKNLPNGIYLIKLENKNDKKIIIFKKISISK